MEIFDTGVVCNDALMRMIQDPLCFIGGGLTEQELMKGLLLTGKMTDSQYRKLVSMNVSQYMKMLKLSPTERRNSEMLASWLFSGIFSDNDNNTL